MIRLPTDVVKIVPFIVEGKRMGINGVHPVFCSKIKLPLDYTVGYDYPTGRC
jgi:hypothetical protein